MRARGGILALLAWALGACAARPAEMPRMDAVDLPRFMGDWYVIAHIPSWPERHAHNAIESYALQADGRIGTTFRYRNAPGARLKVMRPDGTVVPGSGNAVWGMQFIWPIRAEYVIAYVSPDYQETIVARSKRDYAWIMARTPSLAPERYEALLARLLALGYAAEDVRRVPQDWPEPGFPGGREPVR